MNNFKYKRGRSNMTLVARKNIPIIGKILNEELWYDLDYKHK